MNFVCHVLQKLRLPANKPALTKAALSGNNFSISSCHSSEVQSLPKARFPGQCFLINNPAVEEIQYEKAINSLLTGNDVLGFDMETRPSLSRGMRNRPPCLVQLASEEVCVMWRLRVERKSCNYVGRNFPPLLCNILTSKNILKVGHGSRDDAYLLLKHYKVNTRNILDTYILIDSVDFDLEGKNVKVLTSSLLGLSLEKSRKIQMSNWEQEVLSEEQVRYACNDAWVSLQIYKSLASLAKEKGLTMVPPIEDARQVLAKILEKKMRAKIVSPDSSLRPKLKPPKLHKHQTHISDEGSESSFAGKQSNCASSAEPTNTSEGTECN